MRKLTILILVLFFICSYSFAQEEKSIKSNPDEKSSIEKINSTETIGDEILFKNDNDEAIITFTDEGSNVGSITLPSLSLTTDFTLPSTNKLYNHGGILHFNGTALGSGGAAQINDLSDAIYDGSSLFLGLGTGINDDGSTNSNTAVGRYTFTSNETGFQNTAIGGNALYSNIGGNNNTAIGFTALFSNLSGLNNTAVGVGSLYSNTVGYNNVALGYQSLNSNKTSHNNTAIGYKALHSSINAYHNTAIGSESLYNNSSGTYNVAVGFTTLHSNTTGGDNVGIGALALSLNESGYRNTAIGTQALKQNTSGVENTGCGEYTLWYCRDGNYNTALGKGAGIPNLSTSPSNTTALGYKATATASNQVRIGNSSVTSIGGYQNWTNISDIRYKRDIREDVSGIDFIIGLRPITYNLDTQALADKLGENMIIDENGNSTRVQPSYEIRNAREQKASKRNSGFIAQEVEELSNRLGYDFSGVEVPENDNSFYRLRYAEFVVPLVKAVQEQQKMIADQEIIIAEIRKEIEELKRR